MRIALVFVALTASACVTVSPRVSASVGRSNTSKPPLAAALDFGIYVPVDDGIVVNPFLGGIKTPLGEHDGVRAAGVSEWGVRAFKASEAGTSGLYGYGSYNYDRVLDANGCTFGIGLAQSRSHTAPASTDHEPPPYRWPTSIRSEQVGLVYHHTRQGAARGDFLGVELTLVFGKSAWGLFSGLEPRVH